MAEVSPELSRRLLSLQEGQCNRKLLHELFAYDKSNKRLCEPNDTVVLDEKIMREVECPLLKHSNIADFLGKPMGVGRFVLNLGLFSATEEVYSMNQKTGQVETAVRDLRPLVKLRNEVIKGKVLDGIYEEIVSLMIEEKITGRIIEKFIDNLNWLGFTLVPYLNPSLDFHSLYPPDDVVRERDRILKENKEIIDNNDVIGFSKNVEPAVLKAAEQSLRDKGSTGLMIYDSGANGSFAGNYKITALMRGVVAGSDDPSKFSINVSSLSEGVSREETTVAGDIAVQGSIGRAISTRQGGYIVKQFYAGFQSLVADQRGTDCGTSFTLTVEITKKNYEDYLYRFVRVDGKDVMMDKSNRDQFVGKKVQLRSPFYCQNQKVCHKCLGDMLHRLGVRNIGLTTANIGSTLLVGALKAFHSLSVKSETYDLAAFMTEIK